jgi:O-antigen/teichoic acid export membrane protein
MAVVTHFFGINEAGLYALARLTIRVPSNLLGKSIADVLYPRFFELLYDKKAIIRLLNKSTIALIVIGFFPVLIAFFYADILFGNIFGSDWVSSADYARWIVLWGYINLICRPSVALIPILKMELVFVKNSIFNMLITCAALMIGVVHFSEPSEMIKLLSIAAMLPQLLVIIIAYVKVRNHEKE